MKASHSKTSKHRPIKVKLEKSDGNQTQTCPDEKDLTFYVKDRVELMRQIFSILKDRELYAMAPDCLRGQRVDGLQEALLDEVLGISSKRLHAILDGIECPTNTDSSEESSADALETISLDSISSDEDDILSPRDHKSKKKHIKKKSKLGKEVKNKKRNSDSLIDNGNTSKGKKNKKESKESQKTDDPSGTGMTVLELLELQARARAIRAQLAAVEVKDTSNNEEDNESARDSLESDEDEVVIKEEPPEIVEIQSSSDEGNNDTTTDKPKKNNGDKRKANSSTQNQTKSGQSGRNSPTTSYSQSIQVTSNISLQDKQSQSTPRKIKLNRTNLLVSVTNNSKTVTSGSSDSNIKLVPPISPNDNDQETINSLDIDKAESSKINSNIKIDDSESRKQAQSKISKSAISSKSGLSKVKIISNKKIDKSDQALLEKIKNSYLKNNTTVKKTPIVRERKESEEDEITLELSDSEKMDLLEGFHSPKSFEIEDIEINLNTEKEVEDCSTEIIDENSIDNTNIDIDAIVNTEMIEKANSFDMEAEVSNAPINENITSVDLDSDKMHHDGGAENSVIINNAVLEEGSIKNSGIKRKRSKDNKKKQKKLKDDLLQINKTAESESKDTSVNNSSEINAKSLDDQGNDNINKSDGECSYSSDGVKDIPEILCISDDQISENSNDGTQRQYRKKLNNSSDDDIHKSKVIVEDTPKECAIDSTDQFDDTLDKESIQPPALENEISPNVSEPKLATEDNMNETKAKTAYPGSNTNVTSQIENKEYADCILEISDDSEDEVSGGLSKEPTREEIEELSRKIDYEIDRESLDILGDSSINLKITEDEPITSKDEINEVVSWKTRWLKSDKVQRVLATSNLCNALRKKNKELKKKLENDQIKNIIDTNEVEEKSVESTSENPVIENINELHEIEGSISQYEKLSGSTKYVDPVVEPCLDEKAMATDAKQLMKMYKKLLKMHDLDEGEKKKAKKHKKDKKREKREKKKNKSKALESSDIPCDDKQPKDNDDKQLKDNDDKQLKNNDDKQQKNVNVTESNVPVSTQ